ncbi:MAG: hypothetical protein ACTSXW_03265 [Candidatus Baldrarchaeia archaeon]
MSKTEINGLKVQITRKNDWTTLTISSGDKVVYFGDINRSVLKDKEELLSVVRDIAKIILEGKALKLNNPISFNQEKFEEELVKKLLEE